MSPVTSDRLSLNTATVRAQWTLAQCIDGCARHGYGGISPWRDKLHEMGVDAAARAIRDAGLSVSGLCRGGWFTAEGAFLGGGELHGGDAALGGGIGRGGCAGEHSRVFFGSHSHLRGIVGRLTAGGTEEEERE